MFVMFCVQLICAFLPCYHYATNCVSWRIANADSAASLSRYADYPPSTAKFALPRCLFEKPFLMNEKFWLNDIDFSSVSPWNDEWRNLRAGTLISKRHIIFAKHYPLSKGARILFVDKVGEVCPSRVCETKALEETDVMIGLLDYEVTPNIHPAKILPENYEMYIGDGIGLPVVTFNQREQAFVSRLVRISNGNVINDFSTNETWKALSGRVVGGDSGHPTFLLIGNEAILLYCVWSGGAGNGPSLLRWRRAIQKAMDELCPGYKLESFDFEKVMKNLNTGVK